MKPIYLVIVAFWSALLYPTFSLAQATQPSYEQAQLRLLERQAQRQADRIRELEDENKRLRAEVEKLRSDGAQTQQAVQPPANAIDVVPPPIATPVRPPFTTLQSILAALPLDAQPPKGEPWKSDLMLSIAEKWFKENVVGRQMVTKELFGSGSTMTGGKFAVFCKSIEIELNGRKHLASVIINCTAESAPIVAKMQPNQQITVTGQITEVRLEASKEYVSVTVNLENPTFTK